MCINFSIKNKNKLYWIVMKTQEILIRKRTKLMLMVLIKVFRNNVVIQTPSIKIVQVRITVSTGHSLREVFDRTPNTTSPSARKIRNKKDKTLTIRRNCGIANISTRCCMNCPRMSNICFCSLLFCCLY